MIEKPERIKNRTLLNEVASRRCLVYSNCYGRIDPHHVTTVGAGGGDTYDNCVPLCSMHHSEIHNSGRNKFIKKYPVFLRWLKNNNRWDIIDGFKNLEFDLTNKIKING